MGLTNLQSILDLVPGTNPVSEMASNQGPSFDLGPSSNLQIDSLSIVPQTSPYQDLDGEMGPPSQLPIVDASQAHIDSLQQVPGGVSNSPYQDLNGEQGPQFDLGINSILQQNSLPQIPNKSQYQDLNGEQGPQFDFGPEPGNPDTIDTMHESALLNLYESIVNPEASYGQGQPNGVWPVVNSTILGLGGNQGPQFNQGVEPETNEIDTIHESNLEGLYQSIVNPTYNYGAGQASGQGAWPVLGPTTLDLNGVEGPQFNQGIEPTLDTNQVDSFHESALVDIYNSAINPGYSYGQGQPGSNWPTLNPTSLSIPNIATDNPSQFDNGPEDLDDTLDTLHESLLENAYESAINPNYSYGYGQPGSNWPNVQSTIAGNYSHLNIGIASPSQYINNLPD